MANITTFVPFETRGVNVAGLQPDSLFVPENPRDFVQQFSGDDGDDLRLVDIETLGRRELSRKVLSHLALYMSLADEIPNFLHVHNCHTFAATFLDDDPVKSMNFLPGSGRSMQASHMYYSRDEMRLREVRPVESYALPINSVRTLTNAEGQWLHSLVSASDHGDLFVSKLGSGVPPMLHALDAVTSIYEGVGATKVGKPSVYRYRMTDGTVKSFYNET
jgi:hypothetical protein